MSILDFTAIEHTRVETEPFYFMVSGSIMSPEALASVNRDYPAIEIPANYKPEDLSYGPAFAQLLEEIDSPEFEALIGRKFDIDLSDTEKSITVRKYSEMSDGNIHTDHWTKVMTVLIYFNEEWTQEGGKLRLLRRVDDIEDYLVEVTPIGGTLLAFRRSDNSFHGYKRFEGERRMVQVNWIRSGPIARRAQRLARFGTHTGKRLLRLAQPFKARAKR